MVLWTSSVNPRNSQEVGLLDQMVKKGWVGSVLLNQQLAGTSHDMFPAVPRSFQVQGVLDMSHAMDTSRVEWSFLLIPFGAA